MDILFKDLEEDVNMQDWEKKQDGSSWGGGEKNQNYVWMRRTGKHPGVFW